MTRIGIHLSYWQRNWGDDLIPLIYRAASIGFDGVEIPLLEPERLPVAGVRGALAAAGLGVTAGTGLGPATDITSPEPAVCREGLAHLRRCLEVTAAIGGKGLGGVTYAPWGTIHSPIERPARRQRAVAAMREAGHMAGELGVTLHVELLNRFEGYLIGSVAEGRAFLAEVGSPHVRLHLDTFHLNIEADSIAGAIAQAGADLGHFHCSENNRRLPGQGHIPWREVRAALAGVGYTGWLTIESFTTPNCEVGEGLSIWRSLGEELDSEAAGSLYFLRGLFGPREGRTR